VKRLAVACLALASCGGAEGPSVMTAPVRAGAFPPVAPLARPGEVMTYQLSVHGIDVATLGLAVGDRGELDGREVVVVQSGVVASPLVQLVAKVESNFATWIDTATARPLLFRAAEEAEPDDPVAETTDSELATIDTGAYRVTVARNADPIAVEQQVVHDAPVFDLNSFLIRLRSWEAPPGTVEVADVVRSRYLWRTWIELVGDEAVATSLGDLPAVRFEGRAQRLHRDGRIDETSPIRSYALWISDDADRVPLRLIGRTAYGDIAMELVEYLPPP